MVGNTGMGGKLKAAESALDQFEALAFFLQNPDALKELKRNIAAANEASERAGVTADLNKARREAKAVVEKAKEEVAKLKAQSVEHVRDAEKQAKKMLDEIRSRQTEHEREYAARTAELDAREAVLQDRKADLDSRENDLEDLADKFGKREEGIKKEEARLADWANRMKAATRA